MHYFWPKTLCFVFLGKTSRTKIEHFYFLSLLRWCWSFFICVGILFSKIHLIGLRVCCLFNLNQSNLYRFSVPKSFFDIWRLVSRRSLFPPSEPFVVSVMSFSLWLYSLLHLAMLLSVCTATDRPTRGHKLSFSLWSFLFGFDFFFLYWNNRFFLLFVQSTEKKQLSQYNSMYGFSPNCAAYRQGIDSDPTLTCLPLAGKLECCSCSVCVVAFVFEVLCVTFLALILVYLSTARRVVLCLFQPAKCDFVRELHGR